jgi:alkylation response protein AidB-like acyl-CoA dehydrogenase
MNPLVSGGIVDQLIANDLKPNVSLIDQEGLYPGSFLKKMGQAGLFSVSDQSPGKACEFTLRLIERVAAVCNSTAFTLWCHTASMNLIRFSDNPFLKSHVLPSLEKGEFLGGTGLSNPMKYYAGLEPLRLKAEKTINGYRVTGTLPFVSNLGDDHWFGIIAELNESQRIAALVSCRATGLAMEERENFLGLNGTATYTCKFEDVWIPAEWILDENADRLVRKVRPYFVMSQIGLALGLIYASIDYMVRLRQTLNEVNQYLPLQPEDLERKWKALRDKVYHLAQTSSDLSNRWEEIIEARLKSAYLAVESAQAELFHSGGRGYVKSSPTSRRLREAYFIAVLTPAIKHLEKLLHVTNPK